MGMFQYQAQGNIVVMDFGDGMCTPVCIAVTNAMAERIAAAMTSLDLDDLMAEIAAMN